MAPFVLADLGYNQGWRLDRHIRAPATSNGTDLNSDGMQDLVAFDTSDVKVVRSSNLSPPPPLAAPSNLRAWTALSRALLSGSGNLCTPR